MQNPFANARRENLNPVLFGTSHARYARPTPEFRSEIAKADENFRRAIRRQLDHGIRAGEIRATVDPATEAALIVAALRGLVIQRMLNRDSFNLDSVCKAFNSNLERTLKRPRAEK